ncbi:MAG: SDR family NAD(P)-dependent oxidoreductase [Lachnospiraceae bacterium]|nr:SDR family NAD(P)-dependent oxidoreductase [Lachnospiraceae bacterium]
MNAAVITGASSGLGCEFARQLDNEPNIDEFWLIARRREKMEAFAETLKKPSRILPIDLTKREELSILKDALHTNKPVITYLICAAGTGRMGKSMDIPPDDNAMMIDLNCRAAVDVTQMCYPYLRKGSRVLEISSTASFQPLPRLNVYSASKAFLTSYTKMLHYELIPRGIKVTAVCPYWIKDTEFIGQAEKTSKDYSGYFLASRTQSVVKMALFDSKMNFWVSTPGPVCFVHRIAAKFIPHEIMVPLVDLVRKL